jgi:ABC-type transport system involved in cytochrome c biogenesis permease subunit
MTGSVWAHYAWGAYWSWDPKETWSLITWIVYALMLHSRSIRGWRGRPMAWMALVGFASVLFTYLGVNYLDSLHSYF